jgi:pyrimidine operon attenuation protein/uracil phosphoribosyltransferase
MAPDLTTTNVLLGILAAVSVLEVLGLIGLFAAGIVMAKRLLRAIDGIESRQIAPAAARVNAILDDVRDMTATVKSGVEGVDNSIGWVIRLVRRAARV